MKDYLFIAPFPGAETPLIGILSISDNTTILETLIPINLSDVAGVAVQDIDCDGKFEMAVAGGGSFDSNHVKFYRLMNPADLTSWSDLNADLIIQNNVGDTEGIQFANLDYPCRWDLVVTTSVGAALLTSLCTKMQPLVSPV